MKIARDREEHRWQWPKRRSPFPRRSRQKRVVRQPLSISQILAWADAHHARTGKWPVRSSGCVHEAPAENWNAISSCLYLGFRGLPGGCTLRQLLVRTRGLRTGRRLAMLGRRTILRWADAYYARHGRWPTQLSGVIPEADGETWSTVDTALRVGLRGCDGGSSLSKLLDEWRRKREFPRYPRLTVDQILEWADEYFATRGRWPGVHSGGIARTRGETWRKVNLALCRGDRGLPGRTSLARLLETHGRGTSMPVRRASPVPLSGNSGYDQGRWTAGSINPMGAT
jgi:hypothetical protein